jgi:hypothetical protein
MSADKLIDALRFHGRYGNESEEQARLRRYQEREAASARIAELEQQLTVMTADRDSWAEQASQRLADWDAMRLRAESAEQQLEQARKDAARCQWVRERFLGADFDWGSCDADGTHGTQVLLIKFDGGPVWGNFDMTVDAAIASQGTAQEGGNG